MIRRASKLWRKEKDMYRSNSDPPPYSDSNLHVPSLEGSRVGLHLLYVSQEATVEYVTFDVLEHSTANFILVSFLSMV